MSINLSNDLIESAGVCQNCFIKFNEIDEHQAIIEKIQQELLVLFTATQSNIQDTKTEFKSLEDDIQFTEVYENGEEILTEEEYLTSDLKNEDGSDVIERVKRKRGPRKKKNLDEGLIMVEVDGQKYYQCELCKKVFKDRYKLKTHKETHNEDRNICCNECGAM